MPKQDPIRPTDDAARHLARSLLTDARHGALATLSGDTPFVTRIAVAAYDGRVLTLVSDLAAHTVALRQTPKASLLIGEPGPKGDPLTHPRMTLQVRATFLEKTEALIERYLATHPKAQLYIRFTDFHFVLLDPTEVHLNGGFGKAYRLTAGDLSS